jgi:peptidyl-prolyl cis-trans isomerase B (cyclophilin B)
VATSSKRERELARLRAQRQAARRAAAAAEARKRRNAIFAGLSALAVAAVIVVIALVTDDGSSSNSVAQEPTAGPSGPCPYTASGTATKAVQGLPSADGPAEKKPVQVKVVTNRGEIDLTLDGEKAPCTTNSFAFLAAQKYFDNTSCHRLTTSGIFVLQCGDPGGTGAGGPGYSFKAANLSAFDNSKCSAAKNLAQPCQVTYPRGTIAMANSGPNTNGSQFFLVYKNSPLGPAYTPFGRITKGLQLLDAVAKGGSIPVADGKPKLPVLIKSITIVA